MSRLRLNVLIIMAAVSPGIGAQRSNGAGSPVAQIPPQRMAPCQSFPGGASGEMALVSSFVAEPSYVDLPVEKLKGIVHLLNPTMPEETQSAAAASVPPTDETQFILSKTGAAITELLHRTPNLTANEHVRLTGQNLNSGHLNINGRSVALTPKWNNTSDYEYRIVHKRNAFGGDELVESRTDARGQPIDAKNPYRPMSIGFATMWLIFLPGNLNDSRFRYLGEQSIGRRKTYVVAFAQHPESTRMQPIITYGSGQCSTPLQGVAWIDRSSFQIIRIQSDLLYSLPDIQISQLRSVLTYESVKIGGLGLSLWLPKDVETSTQTMFQTVQESHQYSNYRLFQATMRVLPGFQLPRN